MNIRPLLLKFLAVLALIAGTVAAFSRPSTHQTARQDNEKTGTYVVRPRLVGQGVANDLPGLLEDGNLPEAASVLPLLSAIGAGALLGGLLSARRTRK